MSESKKEGERLEALADKVIQEYQAAYAHVFPDGLDPYEKAAIKTFCHFLFTTWYPTVLARFRARWQGESAQQAGKTPGSPQSVRSEELSPERPRPPGDSGSGTG